MLRSAAAWLLMLAACGPGARGTAWPPFMVRGRLDAPTRPVTCCIDTAAAPVDAALFRHAVLRAMATWSDEGAIRFVAADDAGADVAICFRRGAHGDCEPFGPSHAVAHSGPARRGTFVHFDAARAWDEAALHRTALHELGHVLGLDHCARTDAVMSTGDVPDGLGAPDRDGLHSLYGGGGAPDERDLAVVRADGSTAMVVRGLAGPGTDRCTFDVDGDGRDELLLWRTDRDGDGAMLALHFARGPVLERTAGPWTGMVGPGMQVAFVHTDADERLCLCTRPGGRTSVLRFEHGAPAPRAAAADVAALLATAHTRNVADADLDGDGTRETIVPARR